MAEHGLADVTTQHTVTTQTHPQIPSPTYIRRTLPPLASLCNVNKTF